MRIAIEINNRSKKRINSEFVNNIVRKTTKLSGAVLDSLEISIVFVNDLKIREINRKYRKKNKSTDVLSFLYDLGYNKKGKVIEGELLLCPEVIAKNARENDIRFSRELAFVLSHGVLHVLGWKHGEKMFKIQDKISKIK